jgi:cyclohexanecarboxyl-CoA dehydrogenase
MDFSVDQETQEKAHATRQFCEKHIDPHTAAWDRGETISTSIFTQMADLGLMSLRIPSENGGDSASFVECGSIVYEVGRSDVGLALMVVNGVFFGEVMGLMTEPVRARWAPRVAAGAPFAITLTEPEAGSDAASIRTTAVRDGGDYVVNGEKGSVSYAGLAEFGLIFARTGGPGAKGISLLATPWDAPGIDKRIYDSVGERVTKRGQVFYTDLRIPSENLVGSENGGFREAMQFFDYNRAFLTLACIGAAERSLEEVSAHVRSRQAFGGPLARFQGVSFPIAEHLTRLEAAKLLAFKVLSFKDAGLPHSKEAAMVKWFGIKEAYEAIHDCLLLAGWPAYSAELDHDRRMRDVMGLELGDGTSQIMKMVVAREVLGRESLPYARLAPS